MTIPRRLSRAAAIAQGATDTQADAMFGPERVTRKPRLDRIPESQILGEIMLYLRHHPKVKHGSVTRMNVVGYGGGWGKSGRPGMFDLWATLTDGRALWVEVKAADGVVSDEQWAFKAMVEGAHQVAIIARGVDDLSALDS